MFKYKLDQLVYYLKDNRVHSAKVTSRNLVENQRDDSYPVDSWRPFGRAGIFYKTVHGIFEERNVFASKEDLAAALIA